VRAGGLRLAHPVLVAAGGGGYAVELIEAAAGAPPAAVVTRSTTLRARPGNPAPRMTAIPAGLLSSVGLQNPGVDGVLERYAPRWAGEDVPVIVSICADSAEDIAALARTLDLRPGVAGIELNLACPDRSREGRAIGLDVEASETATVAARATTELPLIVKLTPAATDIREVARAVAAAGADAIGAVDLLPGLAVDRERDTAAGTARGTALGTGYGGISGPLLKPVALRAVYDIAQVVRIPIIGIGGTSTLEDVLDYLAAGASAVGLATAALADPLLPGRLGQELAEWCASQGLGSHREVIGRALPRRRDRGGARIGPYRL
jgi:dihydroorotate dehydrogenase (NAD+) catalytic subunit